MELDKKIKREIRRISDLDLRAEFLESFAGGAGKAAGMGAVIALALLIIKLLGLEAPKLP